MEPNLLWSVSCLGDEHRPSLAGKQACKSFRSDFGLYLVGELWEASLTVGWEQGKKSVLVGFQDFRSCEEPVKEKKMSLNDRNSRHVIPRFESLVSSGPGCTVICNFYMHFS